MAKVVELKTDIPALGRMDMVSDLAPLALKLAVQVQKRGNQFKGNMKISYVRPDEDAVHNDFKREMLFHIQAQAAAIVGTGRLHAH